MKKVKICLASGSARRRQLLEDAGFLLEIETPNVSEEIGSDLGFREAAIALAKRKLIAATNVKSLPILAADTLVHFESNFMGKPKSESEARKMLKVLSGVTHEV